MKRRHLLKSTAALWGLLLSRRLRAEALYLHALTGTGGTHSSGLKLTTIGIGRFGDRVLQAMEREGDDNVSTAFVDMAEKNNECMFIVLNGSCERHEWRPRNSEENVKRHLVNLEAMIDRSLDDTPQDVVFLVAALDEVVGSQVTPRLAASMKKKGALTIAVVIIPQQVDEGSGPEPQEAISGESLARLNKTADLVIVLRQTVGSGEMLSEVLGTIQLVTNLVLKQGWIGVDLADLRVMATKGKTGMVGFYRGSIRSGIEALVDGALAANPVFSSTGREAVKGVVVNISTGAEGSMAEVAPVFARVREMFGEEVMSVCGWQSDLVDAHEVRVAILAVR